MSCSFPKIGDSVSAEKKDATFLAIDCPISFPIIAVCFGIPVMVLSAMFIGLFSLSASSYN